MKEKPVSGPQQARRDAILDVAGEVFSREGYAATSMSHIASLLGGSKGTLYNYFRNKEELFLAHIQERCGSHVQAMFSSPLAGDSPLNVLAELAEKLLTFILSDEAVAFYSLVVAEAQRNPDIGRTFFESGPRTGTRCVIDYLERARIDGKLALDDCDQAAKDFLSLVQSDLYRRRVLNMIPAPSTEIIRAEARHAAETFVRIYGPCRH